MTTFQGGRPPARIPAGDGADGVCAHPRPGRCRLAQTGACG